MHLRDPIEFKLRLIIALAHWEGCSAARLPEF
jgi:hypothetical protein